MSKRRLSEQERAQRRAQDRARLKQAAEELLTSEGWARWVRVRATFHSYSAGNCMLLAWQCHERGIVPERVAGFRAWLKLGRVVKKNEKALRILAPVAVKERDEQGDETGERRVFFKTAFVFDVSMTDPLPGKEPVPLSPPSQPITGDSHQHLIARLTALAEELGYTAEIRDLPDGGPGGWCDPKAKQIVIGAGPANGQVRTLTHEIAHALGIGYAEYGREQAEVLVDCVTYIVCSSVGLEVGGESIPYVAGWGEDGALDAIRAYAGTIDTLARRIEDALNPGHDAEAEAEVSEPAVA